MSVMLIISFHTFLYLLSFLHGIHFVNASRQLFKNAGIFNGNKCGECGELWPIQQKFKSCKHEKKFFFGKISVLIFQFLRLMYPSITLAKDKPMITNTLITHQNPRQQQ